jgi:hypothetical protein
MGRPSGNTGPFRPWSWDVEPWPWHDVDGVRYCDEHGVYQCRLCESAHLAATCERAIGLLELTADLLNQYVGESLDLGKPERAHAPAEALAMVEEFLRKHHETAAEPAKESA